MFEIPTCKHLFCRSCLKQHVNMTVAGKLLPKCPDPTCTHGPVEAHHWRDLLTRAEFEAVSDLAAEAAILALRLFCPHPQCSASLLAPAESDWDPRAQLDCPHCKGALCPLCMGLPHPDMDCAAYKAGAGNVSDAAIHRMAQEAKWQQCPSCRTMVSRILGCNYMRCHCGIFFCYNCGKEYTAEAARTHRCSHCNLIYNNQPPPEAYAAARPDRAPPAAHRVAANAGGNGVGPRLPRPQGRPQAQRRLKRRRQN